MKKTIIIVTALIKKDDKYLLTKRYDPKRPIVHETWQLVGGGLRFGESILECLHREVREETGHQIEVISILPFIHEKYIKEENWHGIAFGYLCKLKNISKKIRLNVEATEYDWFTLMEAKKLKLHHGVSGFLNVVEKVLI